MGGVGHSEGVALGVKLANQNTLKVVAVLLDKDSEEIFSSAAESALQYGVAQQHMTHDWSTAITM